MRIDNNASLGYSRRYVPLKTSAPNYKDVLSTAIANHASPGATNPTSPAITRSESKSETSEPSYQLTGDQIDYFKSKYNVAAISVDAFHQLMDELADLGIVSEEDGSIVPRVDEFGNMGRIRPLHLGLRYLGPLQGNSMVRIVKNSIFDFADFQGGNITQWLEAYMTSNNAIIDWTQNSPENLNTDVVNQQNIASYRDFNRRIDCIKSVLNQLS
jgi:hypothetical protein